MPNVAAGYCGLNVCGPPEFPCYNPNPSGMVSGGGPWGRLLDSHEAVKVETPGGD